jgi:TRAP-type transport system periplasmic protein
MKKTIPVLLSLVILLSFLVVACQSASPAPSSSSVKPSTAAAAPPAKTYKLTYNNFFPPTHLNSKLAEKWIAEIKAKTNGAVTFDYLPGASLTAANKVYDGVTTGISDIGFSVVAYTPGIFPATELIDLPHGYPTGYIATMVANDYYNQYKPAEFNKVHVFYFYATGPNVLFSTKKAVNKLEDVKGMVIRSTGIGAAIATSLGGTGYAAAQNEAYELMSKGVIDGSIAPREVLAGWKQAEVVKYVTECYDVGSVSNMYVVMNADKWNSLPADIQKVFTDVSQSYASYYGMVSSYYDKAGMDYFATQPGRQEINLSADEMGRWRAAVKPLVDKTIADIKAKGLPGDDYEKYINDRIKYWVGKAVSDADAAAWVKANLNP